VIRKIRNFELIHSQRFAISAMGGDPHFA